MRFKSTASSIIALAAAGAIANGAAQAQQVPVAQGAPITISPSSANVLNLLAPYLALNATAIGQQTLAGNLAQTVAINNNAAAQQQALAVSDKNLLGGLSTTIALANGTTRAYGIAANLAGGLPAQAAVSPAPGAATTTSTTPIQAVGGFGSVIGPLYQQGVTPLTVGGVTTVVGTPTTGALPLTAALLNTAYGSFTSRDLGVAKNYFANGGANSSVSYASDQRTVTSATTNPAVAPANATLPTANGLPNTVNSVYDLAYNVTNRQSGQDIFGSSRPTQVSAQINNFDSSSLNQLAGNPSFPSGHTNYAYTDSLLLGMLVPQEYQSMLSRGSEYANSRIVLGVHYPLDIIASRAFSAYDLAQAFTNPAYQNGTATTASNASASFNLLNQFGAARSELNGFIQRNCGTTVANCAGSAANMANDPYVPSAANAATYQNNLSYGLPTLTLAQAPQEAAPAGGPDAAILLAPLYGGSTQAAMTIAPGGGIDGNLSTATIDQIIVNTETNALAAFYGTPLSYWTRINLYAAAGYFGNVVGTLSLASSDQVNVPVTIASGGTLDANGLVNGNVAVNAGGTLSGSGLVIGAVAANAGSTIAPGSLAAQAALQSNQGGVGGTSLLVFGNVSFAPTATLAISASSTQTTALFATGTAALNGAAVAVTAPTALGAYQMLQGQRNLILAAAGSGSSGSAGSSGSSGSTGASGFSSSGGIVGTFSGVTSNLLFATPTLSYDSNDVYLTFGGPNFRAAASNRNQSNVANALTNAAQVNPSNPIISSLETLTTGQASAGASALSSLGGSGLTATQNLAFRSSTEFTSTVTDQMTLFGPAGIPAGANSVTFTDEFAARAQGYAPVRELADLPAARTPPAPPVERPRSFRAWATGFGGVENIQGNTGIGFGAENNRIVGGSAGLDYQFIPGALVGIAAGGTSGQFNVPTFATSGSTNGGHVAGYGVANYGPYYGASSIAGSFFSNQTVRTAAAAGLGETDNASFSSREVRLRIEGGRRFAIGAAGGSLTPFVALEVASLHASTFSEFNRTGPTVLGLTVASQDTASVPAFVGARFEAVTRLGNGMALTPTLQVAYVHEFAPQRVQVGSFVGLPQAVFLTDGARPAYNSAQIKAGGELAFTARAVLFANFEGEFSGINQFYGGKGGFRYAF